MTKEAMPANGEFDVPNGLTELLQEFTVAVLRNQPSDLTLFARDYFERKYLAEAGDNYENNNQYSDEESGNYPLTSLYHHLIRMMRSQVIILSPLFITT